MSGQPTGPLDASRWRGVFSILCTPFHADGSLDWPSLAREIRFCLQAGAHGLVCNVNASESWTLSDEERDAIAGATVEQVGGHIPVIVGVSAGSLEVSARFARHAEEIGADAVMAMPPPSRMGSPVDARHFYEGLAAVVDRPIVVQNHDAPLGTRMSPELVSSLINDIAGVDWIKEETIPSGQAMSRQLELCSDKLKGIMGGLAGRYLLDEYRRGAAGTMPACESTDVHAAIWNLLEAGQAGEARAVFDRLLPLLNYESMSSGVYKTVLHWRGVLETDYLRSVSGNPLDALDRQELKEILRSMQELFIVSPPG